MLGIVGWLLTTFGIGKDNNYVGYCWVVADLNTLTQVLGI